MKKLRYYAQDDRKDFSKTRYYFRWGPGPAIMWLLYDKERNPLKIYANMINRIYDPKIHELVNEPEANDPGFRKLTPEEEKIILDVLKGK